MEQVVLDKLEVYNIQSEKLEYTNKIFKLSNDINKLFELYVDMSDLVNIQEEDLNIIKNNIITTNKIVNKAEYELCISKQYDDKINNKKIILLSLIAAGISTPIGILFGIKVVIGTIAGLGISSFIYFNK